MTKQVLRVFLDELKTVRVICKEPSCGMTFELPLEKLGSKFHNSHCPCCHTELFVDPHASAGNRPYNPFVALASASRAFASTPNTVQIELVIPEPNDQMP